jgi:hypothetical protein
LDNNDNAIGVFGEPVRLILLDESCHDGKGVPPLSMPNFVTFTLPASLPSPTVGDAEQPAVPRELTPRAGSIAPIVRPLAGARERGRLRLFP